MRWFPWLALLAGVLPLIFMAIGYWFVRRARLRDERAAAERAAERDNETSPTS